VAWEAPLTERRDVFENRLIAIVRHLAWRTAITRIGRQRSWAPAVNSGGAIDRPERLKPHHGGCSRGAAIRWRGIRRRDELSDAVSNLMAATGR
jgi:hypothetical protein